MEAISRLFDSTEILVPCRRSSSESHGGLPVIGHRLSVVPLSPLRGRGLWAKLWFALWFARNSLAILSAVRRADAVHAPIPGDVGTVGIVLALLLRKPLFVRHCGNWRKQRTVAERAWKFLMEKFAGGRNVMLATGGDGDPPSATNGSIQWIFSTSLSGSELDASRPKVAPPNRATPQLIIACRQDREKGTAKVIDALPHLLRDYPGIRLEVIGAGPYLEELQVMVRRHQLESCVSFRRHLSQPEVVNALRRADLFCYPTSASEGFPKVVLEALAAGLPVIATRVSVLPGLLAGGAGVLLDDDSTSSIVAAVRQCLGCGTKYLEMSAAAVQTARTFSLERWSETIGSKLQAAWGPLRSHA
jgi:glycosyltransferase involved in cell wall biosynthesis